MARNKKESDDSGDENLEKEVINIYQAFNVPSTATFEEIKKAYRQQALLLHPDKLKTNASDAERNEATESFQTLSRYYSILSDAKKRARYDATGSLDVEGLELDAEFATWTEYFDTVFTKLTTTSIDAFEKQYKCTLS